MIVIRKVLFTYLLMLLCCLPVSAQVDLLYNGPFEVAGYEGNASLGFRIQQADTILHGDFIMQKTDLKKLINSEDRSFSFSGSFNENQPVGPWSLKFGKYTVGDSTDLSEYTYRVKVNGIRHEAFGKMSNGKPEGKWLHVVNELKNSRVVNTHFKSDIIFDNGIPQRSFRIENDDYILVGRFLRDGHAHDVWELYSTQSTDAIERWFFSDGILNKIIIDREENVDTLLVYNEGVKDPVLTNLDSRYLSIINLRNRILYHNEVTWQSDVKVLLDENAQYYQRINQVISALGSTQFMPEFKVKVAYLPLSDKEEAALATIKTHFEKSDIISKSLLESSQLKLLMLADPEVLFLLKTLEKIDKEYLRAIGSILDFQHDSILEYIPREGIIPGLVDPKAEVNVSYSVGDSIKRRTFIGADANSFSFDQRGLSGVSELAEYTYLCIDSIQSALDNKLKREEREQQLIEVEERLIGQFKALNTTIDSLKDQSTGAYNRALKGIANAAKEELSKYSAKAGLEGKVIAANTLILCFRHMDSLAVSVARQPQRWEEIKEKYTDQVWNPFTSTIMDEQLKENITKAYKEVLMPYILDEAENITCDHVQALERFIASTNRRMMEMLDEETAKVERKVRKEKDVDVIIELFQIPVEVKNTND